mmetsp:Transcript_141/g.212  ORF Transcript_141/g.212 Transcript_141/m.212 type:complete len:368 (-) Transcript_141:629-1732(-)
MNFCYKSVVLPTTERCECESDHKSISCRRDSIFIKYHIDREPLNRGAYGVVRQCVKKETQDLFAVKTIPKLKDLGNIKDIQAEISTLKFLSHSNVMKLEEVYENENAFHLITPLYRGGTLFDRIFQASKSRKGCLSEEEAAILTKQMLCAIAYCHSQGVVHRDVKPENFMFETKDSEAQLILIDFGYARKCGLKNSPAYMKTLLGTPEYIAPEVVLGRYTRKCDVWSVGVIVYTMLCGSLPFSSKENNEVDLFAQICEAKISFQEKQWANVSSEAKNFVKTLLCKNQTKRPEAEEALNHSWLQVSTKNSIEVSTENSIVAGSLEGIPFAVCDKMIHILISLFLAILFISSEPVCLVKQQPKLFIPSV